MSKKNKKKPRKHPSQFDAQEQQSRNSLKSSMTDAVKHLASIKQQVHAFMKIGHDLFLTSNLWLFTEDVRIDGAKMADACDEILRLRSYMEKLQTVIYAVIQVHSSISKMLMEFNKNATIDMATEYINKLVPVISSFGEELIDCLSIPSGIMQRHEEAIKKAITPELFDRYLKIFKEADEYKESMKEINLANADVATSLANTVTETSPTNNDNVEEPSNEEQLQSDGEGNSDQSTVQPDEVPGTQEERTPEGSVEESVNNDIPEASMGDETIPQEPQQDSESSGPSGSQEASVQSEPEDKQVG